MNAVPSGYGQIVTAKGVSAAGNFVSGSLTGAVKLTFPDEAQYEGDVLCGSPEGEGTMHWSNGLTFQGSWAEGCPLGRGHLTDASGNEIAGCFGDAALVSGPGSRRWHITGKGRVKVQLIYDGALLDSMMHCKSGSLLWLDKNGREVRKYVGEFCRDMLDGEGTMTWPGYMYEGSFHENRFHGQGTLKRDRDGMVYRGEFRNGKYHGLGELWVGSQKSFHGMWKEGVMVGEGKLEVEGWGSYRGEFREGNLTARGHGYGQMAMYTSVSGSTEKCRVLEAMCCWTARHTSENLSRVKGGVPASRSGLMGQSIQAHGNAGIRTGRVSK